MKNISIFLGMILAGFMFLSTTCNYNKEIYLKKGESETRKIDGIEYTLTVNDILDNRCPKNVKCIRAGEAFVHTVFKTKKAGEQLLQFCTGLDCRRGNIGDAETITTSSGAVEVKLISVEPYPVQNASRTSKTAKFAIRKL